MNSQSGQGGGRRISSDASRLNQGGEGETGFRVQSAAVDGTSNKIYATCRGKLSLLKTEPIVLCTLRNPTSYDPVASKKI